MTLQEIIQGCKVNDRQSQQALYKLTAEDLMRTVKRYIKDGDTAKDVFQEGYLIIFQKINQFDPNKGTIGAWTGRILTNLALGHLRKRKVFTNVESLPILMAPVEDENVLDKISADELLAVIYQLPDSYRVIFLLYVVEGYSHKEIADQLEITASTSRSQLVRAKAKLRTILKKEKNDLMYGEAR